ncbi:UNVERIFIED_CONTAM: hypothetical protein K2H54_036189 [Gekko kuhli]
MRDKIMGSSCLFLRNEGFRVIRHWFSSQPKASLQDELLVALSGYPKTKCTKHSVFLCLCLVLQTLLTLPKVTACLPIRDQHHLNKSIQSKKNVHIITLHSSHSSHKSITATMTSLVW